MFACPATDDFFRSRIDHMIDLRHLKADHRMGRCHLKGETGDRLHAVLCAADYNIRWLLRMIAKKGITLLASLYLRLCQGVAFAGFQLGWFAKERPSRTQLASNRLVLA